MLKKTTFGLFILALILVSGSSFAQKPEFTVVSPAAGIQLPEGAKLDLENAADLTAEELKAALEKSSCTTESGDKNLTACYACTDLNCAGTCFQIPCGFYINANQQVPPVAGFRSFVPGCTTTYVSTCNDLAAAPNPPCQLFAFAYPGSKVCVNSNTFVLQSIGCR